MDIVVISSGHDQPGEFREIKLMFEAGLKTFHIRKPKLSKGQLFDYIQRIPKKYHKRLVLHTYHELAFKLNLGGIHLTRKHRNRGRYYQFQLWLKRKKNPNLIITRTFHKMTDVTADKRAYTYSFLSPVFDSITQGTLSAGFSQRALHIIIPQAKQPVFAMGGITKDNLKTVSQHGFQGAALHGTIWEGRIPPSEVFIQSRAEAKTLRLERLEM